MTELERKKEELKELFELYEGYCSTSPPWTKRGDEQFTAAISQLESEIFDLENCPE